MADSVIEPAESSSANVAPVEDLLQTASLQNCQRLVVLGSARSGKSSLVARWVGFFLWLYMVKHLHKLSSQWAALLANCLGFKIDIYLVFNWRRLFARFLNNKFSDSYTPTIENFYRKVYRIRGEVYQLDILDTSGNQFVTKSNFYFLFFFFLNHKCILDWNNFISLFYWIFIVLSQPCSGYPSSQVRHLPCVFLNLTIHLKGISNL